MTTPSLLLLLALSTTARAAVSPPAAGGPMLLALPSGEKLPLLELQRSRGEDGTDSRLSVSYWVGSEPSVVAGLGRERERIRAARVFEVFRVWSVTNAIYDVAVSAVAGRPGDRGQVFTAKWKQTSPQTWEVSEPAFRGLVLPVFPTDAWPSAASAEECMVSALSFVTKLDEGRFGDAWESASGTLRGVVRRTDFERGLQFVASVYGPASSRKALAYLYPASSEAPAERTLVVIRFATRNNGGEGVEDVTLRLDSDRVWRVAAYEPRARVPDDRREMVGPGGEKRPSRTQTVPAPSLEK